MSESAIRTMLLIGGALTAGATIGATVAALTGSLGIAIALVAIAQACGLAVVVILLRRQSRSIALLGQLAADDRTAAWRRYRNMSQQAAESAAAIGAMTAQFGDLPDRIAALRDNVSESERRLHQVVDQAAHRTRVALDRDVNALLTLHAEYARGADLAGYSEWATTPETLLMLASAIRALPDGATVVEFGGGVSTAWLALANQRRRSPVRIVSLEHDEEWAAETSSIMTRIGVSGPEVRLAPLQALEIDGWSGEWYDPMTLEDLTVIDLAFVDGPPGITAPLARYPALPMISEKLAPHGLVVLDDLDRPEEREIRDRWVSEFGLREDRASDRAVMLRRPPERAAARDELPD